MPAEPDDVRVDGEEPAAESFRFPAEAERPAGPPSDAEELWGVRPEEARGRNLFELDINLPVSSIREPIRDCLEGGADQHELVVDAVNRRGRKFSCRILVSPLVAADDRRTGVILLMEPWAGEGEATPDGA